MLVDLRKGHGTDRQTDHTTEKFVEKGRIACAARAIPPDKTANVLRHPPLTWKYRGQV